MLFLSSRKNGILVCSGSRPGSISLERLLFIPLINLSHPGDLAITPCDNKTATNNSAKF
jgi:hypothetical protein